MNSPNTLELKDSKVLMFVGDIYEDLELWYPKLRLEEAGARVVLAGPARESYRGKHGYPAVADRTLAEVSEADFNALVIPGGFMPDQLRRDPKVLELTRAFDRNKKLIAFICHAGWIPISAKIVAGRTVTSTPGIRDDLENAGAVWRDEAVVIDGNFITARRPPDLPAFGAAIVDYLKQEPDVSQNR
ncbi:MAG: type 1 glutamine amidotransferase domain-containing protein [Leptospirales bacterium]|jgi:protease I